MITQIEVESTRDSHPGALHPCYWVAHTREEILNAGSLVLLRDTGLNTPVTVKRTFVSLADGDALPPRSRYTLLLGILN